MCEIELETDIFNQTKASFKIKRLKMDSCAIRVMF